MKKILIVLFSAAILYSSCSKDHFVNPAKNKSFKVSFAVTVDSIIANTWQQVLGGNAAVSFTAKSNDTLTASSFTDSLNLKTISTYNRPVIAGTYDVGLKVTGTAVADTFIRFSALANNVLINKDQTINLDATTTDGVITISKKLLDSTTVPTFTPAGSTTAYNFGLANGYYFIYVASSNSGKVAFTEATTGDLFLANITVTALNQYDLTATLNKTGSVVIHAHPFKLKANLRK